MAPINKKTCIFHIEFVITVILLISVLYIEITKDISVGIEIDDTLTQEAHTKLISEVRQLDSLRRLYELNLKELRTLSVNGGLDRLSSEEAIVGCVFYVEGEPYYYYLTLQEYLEAKFNILPDSASKMDKSYIRPLTPDIEFLARQFVERYQDKTQRALAILNLIQNVEYATHEDIVKHPTVTLMEGGSFIDLVIACGALLKAADIDCVILIFKDTPYAAIGISDIHFEKFQEGPINIIEFGGQKYLVCDVVLPQHYKKLELERVKAFDALETALIIPYEFP